MPEKIAHYVKLARSLAMTSTLALSACGGSADPVEEPVSQGSTTTSTTAPAADTDGAGGAGGAAAVVADAGTASDPDASTIDAGHLSGPLPPPELPRSLAVA